MASFWELRAHRLDRLRRDGATWHQRPSAQEFLQYSSRSDSKHRNRQMDHGQLRRLAIGNDARVNEDAFGPPTEVPNRLAQNVWTWEDMENRKRRSDSVTTLTDFAQKRLKKMHKKFTSAGEAEEYAVQERERSQSPAVQSESELGSDGAADAVRKLTLRGPKAPTDNVEDDCIVCHKPNPAHQAVPCLKCGRHQFCSTACRAEFVEDHCCSQCRKEHPDPDGGDEKEKDAILCLNCGKKRVRAFGPGYACIYCGEVRFCCRTCRDGWGFGNCSRECHEKNEPSENDVLEEPTDCVVCGDRVDGELGTAVPCHGCDTMQFCSIDCKDAHAAYDGHCSATCYRYVNRTDRDTPRDDRSKQTKPSDEETSILDDPRNYEGVQADADLPDLPPAVNDIGDPTSDSIIDHRLIDRGRALQYHLERSHPGDRAWRNAVGLTSRRWDAKMRTYWAQPERRRQLDFLQSKPAAHFGVKLPPLGRHVLSLELESHRDCLFSRVDFETDDAHKGMEVCEYGTGLDRRWDAAMEVWRRRVESLEDWDRRERVVREMTELDLERDILGEMEKGVSGLDGGRGVGGKKTLAMGPEVGERKGKGKATVRNDSLDTTDEGAKGLLAALASRERKRLGLEAFVLDLL